MPANASNRVLAATAGAPPTVTAATTDFPGGFDSPAPTPPVSGVGKPHRKQPK